jgi:hypothetical protein
LYSLLDMPSAMALMLNARLIASKLPLMFIFMMMVPLKLSKYDETRY